MNILYKELWDINTFNKDKDNLSIIYTDGSYNKEDDIAGFGIFISKNSIKLYS